MTPKVSVIMPCYNEPEEIFRRSLNSVVGQTLCEIVGAVEIIIILDNPKNQELKRVIELYQQAYRNIVFLEPGENLGRGKARNLGISFAQGEYIAIHDADDIDVPERLQEQYDFMEKHPEIGVLFSEMIFVDSEGKPIKEHDPLVANQIQADSLFQKRVNHATMFVRRETMNRVRYSDLQFAEDLDLWIQMYINNEVFGYLSQVHTHYLAPIYSTHSEYVEKMKGWKIGAMHVLLKHYSSFGHDPYFYGKLMVAFSDYIMLHLGKESYLIYREGLRSLAKILRKGKK